MIARLRGKPVASTPGGARPRRRRRRLPRPRDAAAVRKGERRGRDHGRDVPARPRGRAPALRLRRPRGARALRSCSRVSGVGPKVALAIVSGSPPAELRRAIAREDTARFEAIPGIGKKTAQRIVLELKEKLGDPALAAPRRPAATRTSSRATRSSSSAGRSSTPSAPSPRSIPSCRRRSGSGSR